MFVAKIANLSQGCLGITVKHHENAPPLQEEDTFKFFY